MKTRKTRTTIAVDVAVLVNEANYETAMEVVRAYEKKEEGD